ncbi:DUF3145 domain-containing protein [Corynebacterium sp. TAE3-ERU12]|uniref:DUF3145 family protein n=1 Tax=Corynebacterium sp. TAE3-ERU12 TaxID=2849491 RepID=UPI001C486533|nr:DUF3145 family protein [Corynebacterium sp. TAE3-ERU12]MBV7295799.1 DUF3145 domain-containing protein [Corynebacterium sp. TAE3-ERU12]
MPAQPTADRARGVVWIHSATPALAPHLAWAMTTAGMSLDSGARPSSRCFMTRIDDPSRICAEMTWRGPATAPNELADALSRWPDLVFEIAADARSGRPGQRICHHPDLGTFAADTDSAGNIQINENRIRAIMARCGQRPMQLRAELAEAIGQPWDELLEPLRPGTAGHAMPAEQPECTVVDLADRAQRRRGSA